MQSNAHGAVPVAIAVARNMACVKKYFILRKVVLSTIPLILIMCREIDRPCSGCFAYVMLKREEY